MCGRYPEPFHYKDINKYFAAVARIDEELGFTPRYNIAPTQLAPIVREDEDGRQLTLPHIPQAGRPDTEPRTLSAARIGYRSKRTVDDRNEADLALVEADLAGALAI